MFQSTNLQALLSRGLLALILSTATLGLTVAPFAASAEAVTRSVKVSVSDLDLDRAAGVARLYSRIEQAAITACGSSEQPGSRFDARDWKPCFTSAVSHAVAQVDEAALTAYHLAKTGNAPVAKTVATGP